MPSMTINYTASEGQRFAAALGSVQGLTNPDGTPRPATAAECKAFVIGRMQQFIIDKEGADLKAAADAAVVVAPFNPT